jgi:hypothetical protein
MSQEAAAAAAAADAFAANGSNAGKKAVHVKVRSFAMDAVFVGIMIIEMKLGHPIYWHMP